MTDNDKMREAFEKNYAASLSKAVGVACTAAEVRLLRKGNGYGNGNFYLNGRWEGWQAAQAEQSAQSVPLADEPRTLMTDDEAKAWAMKTLKADLEPSNCTADEDHVISIAGAYESGIGHCNDNLCNPYKVGSAESFAYDYGKEFGKARGIEQAVPAAIIDSRCTYYSFAGSVCNKCGRIHDGGKSVPVVGDALYWIDPDDDANIVRTRRVGWSPLYGQPTHSITAAELERSRKIEVQHKRLIEIAKLATENDGGVTYYHPDDAVGDRNCCGAYSYKPHKESCWVSMFNAAIAAEGEKE